MLNWKLKRIMVQAETFAQLNWLMAVEKAIRG